MTIASVYRFQNKAMFVHDLRLTLDKNTQIDAIDKFYSLGECIGLFLAGSNEKWSKALLKLEENLENEDFFQRFQKGANLKIDDIKEYFLRAIESTEDNKCNRAGALGFIVDSENKTNHVFKIDGYFGKGCLIEEIEHNNLEVIGSGSFIPKIKDHLQALCEGFSKNDSLNITNAVKLFSTEIKNILDRSGASSFEKLGISPIFISSILVDDSFMLQGGKVQGRNFSSVRDFTYGFEIKKNCTNELVVKDFSNESEITIKNIHSKNDTFGNENELLDPEGLTQSYEPIYAYEKFSPESSYIYTIAQIPIEPLVNGEEKYSISRTVKKFPVYEYNSKFIISPLEEEKIAENEIEVSEEDFWQFRDISNERIVLKEKIDDQLFEQNIKDYLFNKDWLDERIHFKEW